MTLPGDDGPDGRVHRLVNTARAGGGLLGDAGYNGQESQMPAIPSSLLERITMDPNVRFGKPCIRGHRITVQEILEWLSSGASQEQILADYPQLERDDFLAVYAYAAELAGGTKVSGG